MLWTTKGLLSVTHAPSHNKTHKKHKIITCVIAMCGCNVESHGIGRWQNDAMPNLFFHNLSLPTLTSLHSNHPQPTGNGNGNITATYYQQMNAQSTIKTNTTKYSSHLLNPPTPIVIVRQAKANFQLAFDERIKIVYTEITGNLVIILPSMLSLMTFLGCCGWRKHRHVRAIHTNTNTSDGMRE